MQLLVAIRIVHNLKDTLKAADSNPQLLQMAELSKKQGFEVKPQIQIAAGVGLLFICLTFRIGATFLTCDSYEPIESRRFVWHLHEPG
jgi:hypothetical protein